MKRKIILLFSLFFMFLGFVFLYYEKYRIPNEKKKQLYVDKKTVFIVKKEIPANTVITDDIINNNIEIQEIPIEYVPENAISDKEEMYNLKTNTNLYPNTYIYKENLISQEDGFKDGEQLYAFPVTTANSVVKKVKPNSYVSVWVRFSDLEDSLCVIPKIKLYDLVDANGKTVDSFNDSEVAYGIIKTDYETQKDLEIARKFEIYLTLYGENLNIPPEKNFDKTKFINAIIEKE